MVKRSMIIFIGSVVLFLASAYNLAAQEHVEKKKSNEKQSLIINSDQSEKFLYILDGEILSDKDRKRIISGLDSQKIVATEILKSSSELISKYGERAKYGVVLITTNNKANSTKKLD